MENEEKKRVALRYVNDVDLKSINKNFTVLHHKVSDNLKLTPMSRLVYLCVKHQINIKSPYTYDVLKSKFGLSNDVVNKALSDCESEGLWEIIKVKGYKGGALKERNVITLTDYGKKKFEKIPNSLLLTSKITNKSKAFLICIWKHIVDYNMIRYEEEELLSIMKEINFGENFTKSRIKELITLNIFNYVDGGAIEIDLVSFIDIASDLVEDLDRELSWQKKETILYQQKYSQIKKKLEKYEIVEEENSNFHLHDSDLNEIIEMKNCGYHLYDVVKETGIELETVEYHWNQI